MTARQKAGTPVSAPPGDVQQVRQETGQTREQAGGTVGRLAATADVTARPRDKAAGLAGRVKSTARRARQQAAARTESVRGQVAAAGAPVWEAAPEEIRRAVTKGAGNAMERRVPLAVAAAAFGFVWLAVRRWRRR